MKNTTAAKVYTVADLHTANVLMTDAKNNTDSILAQEYLDAADYLNKVFGGYNKQVRHAAFDEMKSLADLFIRRQYSAMYSAKDPKGDKNALKVVSRATRFNVGDFIQYKSDAKTPVDKAAEFTAAVEELTKAIASFIQSEVSFDGKSKKAVPVAVPVAALAKVVEIIGIEGVYARVRDARFIAYTVSGGSSTIGKMKNIEADRVASALLDVYEVQLTKGAYAFETKEKKNA